MRKSMILSGLVVLFSSSAFAAQPNMYSCKDAEGRYEVGYTTTSFVGSPTFSVSIDGVAVENDRTSSEIKVDQTVMGQLVTLLLDRNHIADAPTRTYSLRIPGVRVPNAVFETQLLVGSIGGFTTPETPYQRVDEVVSVTCESSRVFF